MKNVQASASRAFYFTPGASAITLRRVVADPEVGESHEHDLTGMQHLHDFTELVIVVRGSGVHNLDGAEFPVSAGDVFLIHEGQQHYFHSPQKLEIINIMYIRSNLELPESELRKMPGYCALFILEPQYRRQHNFKSRLHLSRSQLVKAVQIAQRMEDEIKQLEPGASVLIYSCFLDIITFLARAYTKPDTNEAKLLLRLGEVIGVLESDFSHNWSLEELLEIAHMSRSNFMRLFKKATSLTPIEYLTNVRVQEAMKLLNTTDMGIMQIAVAVGFSDSNYFARRFRDINGLSPSEFRCVRES